MTTTSTASPTSPTDATLGATHRRAAQSKPTALPSRGDLSELTTPPRNLPHVRRFECKKGQEPSVEVDSKPEKITWWHVENPSAESLVAAKSLLGVSGSELARVLEPDGHSTSRKLSGCLNATLEQLVPSSEDPNILHLPDLHIYITDHSLVTFSNRQSNVVDRVWDEVARHQTELEETAYTSYLASRLVGCITHLNYIQITRLEERLSLLAKSTAARLPTEEERCLLANIANSADRSHFPIRSLEEFTMALQEERNLFGAPAHRGSLLRYRGMQRQMIASLDRISRRVDRITNHWDARLRQEARQAQEDSNRLATKIGVAAAIFFPSALVFDFLQVPFANGWTDGAMWAQIGGSLVVSGALIGMMFWGSGRRTLNRLLNRAPDAPLFRSRGEVKSS